MGQELNQLNLTVVALVALVAIVGLVALVMNAASVKIPGLSIGSQLASAQDQNNAGDAFTAGGRAPTYVAPPTGSGGGITKCSTTTEYRNAGPTGVQQIRTCYQCPSGNTCTGWTDSGAAGLG